MPKLEAIWQAIGLIKPLTVAMAAVALAIIGILRRIRPSWPGFLIAVGITAALTGLLQLDVATVGSVKSLLSVVVADGMTRRRHRSNCELVKQDVANVASVLFGGMPATGTIARNATSIRAGAHSPGSGMLHAVYVLLFILVAAALGAVLTFAACNMAAKEEFNSLLTASRGDAFVLLSTFLLTVFEDLTLGFGVGVTLGAFLFLHRMAEATDIEDGGRLSSDDRADDANGRRDAYEQASTQECLVYKVTGALFFGATATLGIVLDRIGVPPKIFIFDLSELPLIYATAAQTIETFSRKMRSAGTQLIFAGAKPAVQQVLTGLGLLEPGDGDLRRCLLLILTLAS